MRARPPYKASVLNVKTAMLRPVLLALAAGEATAFLVSPGSSIHRTIPSLRSGAVNNAAAVRGTVLAPRSRASALKTKMEAATAGTATLVKPEEAKLALSFFIKDEGAKITPTSGGVNNVVQYVELSNGERYVLRIYNNGCNTGRVKFEHAVVKSLENEKFTFEIPRYLPSLETGETFVELPSGASACVCHLIPGDLPKTADPTTLGRSVGELLMGLGKVGDPGGYRTPPYYEVYEVHHACSKDKSAPRLRTRPTSSILAASLTPY